MWIWIALPLWITFAAPSADNSTCISLLDYAQTMRAIPLRDVDLYNSSSSERMARVVELDLSTNPRITRFEGTQPEDLGSVCVLRDDVERQIAYQLSVIVHDSDGVACVTFDEGRPHSKLFQRLEHNQGLEARLHPYARRHGEWRRIDARAGFTQEVFLFDCGVRVGDSGLLDVLKDGLLDGGDTVVRADSPLAAEPGFEKKSEFQWNGKAYWTGTGLAVPSPSDN